MTVQQAIRTQVLSAVATGTPVAWNVSPRDADLPRIVLWLVSGTFDLVLAGPSGLRTAGMQVDVWGRSYKEVEELAEAILGELNGWVSYPDKIHGVFATSRRDFEPRPDIADREFRVSLDFDVVFWA